MAVLPWEYVLKLLFASINVTNKFLAVDLGIVGRFRWTKAYVSCFFTNLHCIVYLYGRTAFQCRCHLCIPSGPSIWRFQCSISGAGTVADIVEPKHRGKAIAVFMLGPQLGPVLDQFWVVRLQPMGIIAGAGYLDSSLLLVLLFG